MPYLQNKEKKCAICGYTHKYQRLGENNSFGMRDLDTRPPGMLRNMMHLMVEKCPNCGYASYDISKLLDGLTVDEINSTIYQDLLNDKNLIFSIKKFYLCAILYENRDAKLAGMSYLKAAWMADDAKNFKLAKKLRGKSIKYLEISLKGEKDENINLILVDLYRRVDLFEEAFDLAKYLLNNLGLEKYKQNILLYQMQLCKNNDNLDHTIPGNYNFYETDK